MLHSNTIVVYDLVAIKTDEQKNLFNINDLLWFFLEF